MSANGTNGIDGADLVTVSISVDGGSTYSSEITIGGSAANQYWDFTATGSNTITYDGNNTPTAVTSSTGSGGITTVTINIPNVNSQVRVRVAMLNNVADERWVIDDLRIRGTVSGNTAPILTTPTSTSITNSTAILGATITSNGGLAISESGVVYGGSAAPTGNPTPTSPLVTSGVFTLGVSSLSPQTLYYYRGYAVNSVGTGYSADGTFRTWSNAPTGQATSLAGEATSQTDINLTWVAATFPGSGATTKGYVLLRATSPNTPTLGNGNGTSPTAGLNTTIVSSNIAFDATSQSSGSLAANTTYNYILVPFCWDGTNAATYNYLTTSAPTAQATTWPNLPTITTTNAISGISENGATSGGTTLNANGGTIAVKGVVWNTTTSPTLPGLGSTSNGSGTTNYTSTITGLNAQTQYYVRAYATNEGGTGYGTNVSFRTFSNPPTVQASNLVGTTVSSVAINLTWTAATFPATGATTKKYILLRAVNPTIPSLSNGNGAAPAATTGTTIISSTIAEGDVSYSVTGLAVNVKYNFLLIPCTWDGTNAATYNYLTASAPTATKTTFADAPSAPTVNSPTTNTLNVSPVLGTNPNTTEFALYESTTSQYIQTDGTLNTTTVWQTNATWGTKTVTGLANATSYTFQAKARNLDNIETSLGSTSVGTTYAVEPTAQPTALIFSNVGTTTMDVSYTPATGTPDYYLVLRRPGSAPTGTPADGTSYTINQTNVGGGTNTVAYIGTSTSFSETSLASGTTYYYEIYSFNGSGSAVNYYTNSPLEGNQLTFPAAPVANASSNATSTSFSANWSASTGAASYRLDVATDIGFSSLVPGYNDLNVLNVTTYSITGLIVNTPYFYRVRAINATGTSVNSNIITTGTMPNYYSKGNLAPNVLANWSSTPDGTGAAPASFTLGTNYIVQIGHSMTTTAIWSFGTTGSILQIQNGGTLQADHIITIATNSKFKIDNGGSYIQNVAMSISGNIFAGIEEFGASSNFTYNFAPSGTTAPTSPGYGNLTINTATNGTSLGWSGDITQIQGDFTILSTGTGAIRHALCAAGGNITVSVGGNFTLSGSNTNFWFSSGASTCTMNVAGNVSIAGSALLNLANSSGAGTLNVGGNFSQTGGTLHAISAVSSINFTGISKTFTQSSGTLTNTNINWAVNTGASLSLNNNLPVATSRTATINGTIDCGTNLVTGSGTFTLSSGATLKTANETGINGSIATTTRSLNTGAIYEFNGVSAQVTGAMLPSSVNNLTIDNAAGVKLSNTALAVNGTMQINSGKLFILESGKQLTVSGTLTNNAGASGLVIESGGSLIENNGVAATVKRDISNSAWHLISVPNNNTKASTFMDDYLQTWSESTPGWTDITEPETSLIPGIGYGLWSVSGTTESIFAGALNTGDHDYNVTLEATSGANKGANLLGNPYPCFIDWNGLQSELGSVYYWNGSAYVAYSAVGELGVGSRFVPPMQGFFVIAPSTKTFTLTNGNKAHSTPNYYKSASELAGNTLVLATMGESYSDKLFINFNPVSTADFDYQHDAYKLLAYTPGQSELYSFNGNKKLSIDVRPEREVIQLGFRNDQSGTYQIGISDFADINVAYIEDIKTKTYHDLFTGPYSFDYTAGENEQRLLLHFGTTSIPENGSVVNTNIYSYQQTVYVNLADNTKGDIYIYNLAGQLVTAKESASGSVRIGLTSTGVYMVKVVTQKETLTQKVVIR